MTVRNAEYEDMKRLGHIMSVSFRTAFSDFISEQTLDACAREENCAALLEGCGEKSAPQWNLLRGQAHLKAANYAAAAACLHAAEAEYPTETAPLLETAYREQGDYKMAYEYACKQR